MKRSTDRIIVSHAGILPRPNDLRDMMAPGREAEFHKRLPSAVKEIVDQQVKAGFDVINDGEFSKVGGFSGYPRARLSGLEMRDVKPGDGPAPHDVQGRDRRDFPEFGKLGFPARAGGGPSLGFTQAQGGIAAGGGTVATPSGTRAMVFCVGPIKYIGQDSYKEDIANMKAAMQGVSGVEGYLPAVAPGTMEHWLYNEYYKTEEEFLFAIADAMAEEYKAITDAGFVLQIDDPDLPDGWQMYPDMSRDAYHKYADLRVEALNHALKNVPREQIRFHTCWGSQHGPHMDDIPLADIIDLILKIKAECYSVEAANPQHDADFHVFETVKLPDGASYMPGVVSHVSNTIEHPQVVADRLIRYANLLGKENVIAGTDCGMGSRVGHPEVCWAKFNAMVEGSKLATKALF
ncbi:MAG TPA: cobalamin-independent methionine synthase II family protein [Dehalococcoidia bacterium]|nr:cobalamin-independent methionine synthase II family protein [Dehalococcoidia bacterium]